MKSKIEVKEVKILKKLRLNIEKYTSFKTIHVIGSEET